MGQSQQPLKLEHLLDDFAGGEVADEAVDARGTEDATHRAADLRADAGGTMFLVVAEQDALDLLGVAEFEQEFFGAVGRLAVFDDAGGPDLELGGELICAARRAGRSSARSRWPVSRRATSALGPPDMPAALARQTNCGVRREFVRGWRS